MKGLLALGGALLGLALTPDVRAQAPDAGAGLLVIVLDGDGGVSVVPQPTAAGDADGGDADAGVLAAEMETFRRLQQLAIQYGCPQADPPVYFADGGAFFGPSRLARNDCLQGKMAAEIWSFRDAADAGTVLPPSSKMWIITSVLCDLGAGISGYDANRTARGLRLWPP